MRLLFLTWMVSLLLMKTSCTDLFAVYSQDLHIVRNADGNPSDVNVTKLAIKRYVPRAIAYDMEHNRIFVADIWSHDGVIFAIKLSKNYSVVSVEPLVKIESFGIANVVETMTYDPRNSVLYWTDSRKVGVWKLEIPESLKDLKEPVRAHRLDVVEPSGIALDYCNKKLYWSDRRKNGSIEALKLDTQHHEVVKSGVGSSGEYQGIDIDFKTSELMWAETIEDDCVLKTKDLLTSTENLILEKKNCSPHDLTHDDKYVYWSDGKGEGIFRVSRTDSKDVTKIVDAPYSKRYGMEIKPYGLTTLSRDVASIREICSSAVDIHRSGSTPRQQNKENNTEVNFTTILAQPTVKTETSELSGNQTKTSKWTVLDEDVAITPSIDSVGVEDMGITTPILQAEERTSMLSPSYDIQSTSTPSTEKEVVNIVPINILRNVISNKPKPTKDATSEEIRITPSTPIERCSDDLYHIPIIICLAVVSVIFMLSTLFLVIQYYRRVPKYPAKLHVRRIFGPRRKTMKGPTRCRVDDDGVKTDIEDCCQMTECETACKRQDAQ